MAQGKLEEAEKSFREAVKGDSKCADYHASLGHSLRAQGRYDEAEASHREAVKLEPEDPWQHSNLAGTLRASGKRDEAQKAYKRAIELDPGEPAHAYNLASLFMESYPEVPEYMRQAKRHLRRAIKSRPSVDGYHALLGKILVKEGKLKEGQEAFEKAVELNPKNMDYNRELLSVYAKRRKMSKALRVSGRIARLKMRRGL